MPSNTSPILGFGVSGSSTLLAALPPLSLYIHIPWCIKKCPYCDFNSHELNVTRSNDADDSANTTKSRPLAGSGASASQTRPGVRGYFNSHELNLTRSNDADDSAKATTSRPLAGSGASASQTRPGVRGYFNSHQAPLPAAGEGLGRGATVNPQLEARYIDALISDLDYTLPKVWGRRIHTIFFGGGTPSLFSAIGIDAILAAVRARLPLDADAEITMEANPGTFEADKFKGYRDAGVNRLSIGIQSFNAKHLHALGRVHNDTEAKRAIDIAQANFDNINLDLMFALPEQALAECTADVETALSFGTNHLSIYHLTLEPNTLFHRFPPPLPDDELAADMQDMITERLSDAGYEHYETSAFAKSGRQSKHNLNYWRFGDYIGIGAGAHGKISFPDRITREARYKQPKEFMEKAMLGDAIQDASTIAAAELPFEFMLNALRLTTGFPVALFTERTGLPITAISRELDAAEAKGLITRDHVHISPTEKGQMFLNDLLEIFLPSTRAR